MLSVPESNRHHSLDGFTLVELLVVISIVTLLIALLLSAVKKSRESAKRVICLSNQRQMASAIYSYATEYDGAFVPGPPWSNASITYHVYYDPAFGIGDYGQGWWGPGLLFQEGYLTDPKFLYCPSQALSLFTYEVGWGHIPEFSDTRGARYIGYLYRIFGQHGSGIPAAYINWLQTLSIATQGGTVAMTSDIFVLAGSEWWVPPQDRGRHPWPHTNPYGLNVAYSDGHASWVVTGVEPYNQAAAYLPDVRPDAGADFFAYRFFLALDDQDWSSLP